MGSGMAKYSGTDNYGMRRKRGEDNNHFSKEYSEYWRCEPKGKSSNGAYANERNEYTPINSAMYNSPRRDSRRTSAFVSPFTEKNTEFGMSTCNRYK